MMMNNADEASTSRIVEIILRSIHLSDETPVEEKYAVCRTVLQREAQRAFQETDLRNLLQL